jgi:Zn-dependent protease with chaperone function
VNQIRTVLLLGVLTAVLVAIGGALGPRYLYGFTALALIINLVSYFFSDRIVLAVHRAQKVSPEGISRSREYLADETAARLTGEHDALASALEKLHLGAQRIAPEGMQPATASLFIVSPLLGGRGLLNLFSTHPPTEERVARPRRLRGLPRPRNA